MTGREMEAKLVRADDEVVWVLFKGKEVSVPLDKLSEEDREYVTDWQVKREEGQVESVSVGGAASFDGRVLQQGGALNSFEYDYSVETLAMVKRKYKTEDKAYKIAIAVPKGFDPKKPQKVFIAMAAKNNQAEF